MDIREVIKTVNQMQADGVIERYAIGGAVGATFYLEPVATLDVDIFIAFQPEEGSLIVSPKPIFDYLKARGGSMEGCRLREEPDSRTPGPCLSSEAAGTSARSPSDEICRADAPILQRRRDGPSRVQWPG